MKIFSSIRPIKTITKLIIILLLIVYIVGFFSIRYIWQVFNRVNKLDEEKIESSITHFDTTLIKDVYKKLEDK